MGRKSDKMWTYFTKNHGNKKNMTAVCKILVPTETGAPCGQVLKTPDFNTTTLRSHLKAKHTMEYKLVVEFEDQWGKNKIKNARELERLYTCVDTSQAKRSHPDHSSSAESDMSGLQGLFSF
jgi:hypothetical protein